MVARQDFGDALKVVKIEADPCPNLVEKYKVRPGGALQVARGLGSCAGSHSVSHPGKARRAVREERTLAWNALCSADVHPFWQ